MHNTNTDAFLDVKKVLPKQQQQEINTGVTALPGVFSSEFSSYVERLMIISYDTRTISAKNIRDHVQEVLHTDGPATCLISM